ncbi:MAG TPA: hypothetical protein VFX89_10870 [Gammaproteobacteria bacterium]|nr:hypothetical protein [Gammaproteobacteria bacterium]
MPETRVDTIGQLGTGQSLWAVCASCDRRTRLDVAALVEEHGAFLTLRELAKRVKCRRCGKRSGRIELGGGR